MTIPTLPDNIQRIILLIGLVMVLYAAFESQKNVEESYANSEVFNSTIDSLDILVVDREHEKELFMDKADYFSRKLGVPNPVKLDDSTVTFTQYFHGDKNKVIVTDTLLASWQKYNQSNFLIKKYNEIIKIKKENLKRSQDRFEKLEFVNGVITGIGSVIALVGLIMLLKQQENQDDLFKRQLSEKEKYYKYCQSCGRNFSAVVTKGKRENGSYNNAFCSKCYDNGIFTEPELTREEMKQRYLIVINRIYKRTLGRRLAMGRFHNLERWKEDDYIS